MNKTLEELLALWKPLYDELNAGSSEEELDYVEYLQEQICLRLWERNNA